MGFRIWADALAKAKQRGVVFEATAARDAELKPILETMCELPYREIAGRTDQPQHSDTARQGTVECNVGHARDETIGHHGQMNSSPRDVRGDPPGREKFREKAFLFLHGSLPSLQARAAAKAR